MNHKINIFFAGDFCSKSSTSRITISDELKTLVRSCDLKVINFEVPLKPDNINLPPQGRERFFQHDDVPDFLKGLGFNLFSLANNHAFDWGDEGFKKTKAALGEAAFGAGTYEEAYKPRIVEVNGKRIGFLGLAFAAYKGVFDDVTKYDDLGCAYINDLKVNHVIIEAKKVVDYLFVMAHDGIEYIDVPLPETIARYRDLIEFGADGVIAAHPHCPQGWETYKGKPIFYSLGNFLFNSKEGYDYRAWNRPHWYEGLCVVVTISDGSLSWEVVNTRNVDNVGIVIDHNEVRLKHNEQICKYLSDKEAFWEYYKKVSVTEGYNKLYKKIYRTIPPQNMKQCTKIVAKYWLRKMLGKKPLPVNDLSLERLFRHDTNRQFFLWSLRLHQQFSKK